MKRVVRACVLGPLALSLSLLGCAKSKAPIVVPDAGSSITGKTDAALPLTTAAGNASSTPHAEPARPPPRMRVSAQRGTALPVGTLIDQPLTVQLAHDDALTLSLDDYVRVQLRGPATAQLLPAGQAALLLRDGLVTVDVSPRGMRSVASVFWLATPTVRLEVADSVRLALRAFAAGPTELEVVSGYLTLLQAAAPVPMPAGATACATLEQATLSKARSATLERAEAELSSARPCAPKASVTSALLESALTDQLHLVGEALERERLQLEEHGRLVAGSAAGARDAGARDADARDAAARDAGADEASARALRLALARTGAELLRTRERARALRAQFEASALGRELSPIEQPLLRHATKLSVIH